MASPLPIDTNGVIDVYVSKNENDELPSLQPVGKLKGREVTHIPASHNEGENEGIKSKKSKAGNGIVCCLAISLIIAGGVINGTMDDACNHQRPDCNPTLRTAGIGLWAAGVTIIGIQCCIVGIICCCTGVAAGIIASRSDK